MSRFETHPQMPIQPQLPSMVTDPSLAGWRRPAAAAVLAAVTLTACTSPGNGPESTAPGSSVNRSTIIPSSEMTSEVSTANVSPTDTVPSPTQSVSVAPESCDYKHPRVFPNSALNEGNIDDIADQLGTLYKAVRNKPDDKHKDQSVTIGDVKNAGAIMANVVRDNSYASAFGYANTVMALKPPIRPNGNRLVESHSFDTKERCMDTQQVQAIKAVASTLTDGLAPQAGRQVSFAARAAYNQFLVSSKKVINDLPN